MLRRLTPNEIPNTVWPSDNELGIPSLKLDLQAGVVDLPFCRWGRTTRKSRMLGCWHFMTDDYRFSAVWSRPQVVVNSGCVAAVEPNYSIHPQTPPAIAIYQIFRKRWLNRFWQEHGIRTFVDLFVPPAFAKANLLGVPKGWRSFATRGSDQLLSELAMARDHAGRQDVTFLVYGGGAAVRETCREHLLLWFPEESDVVRDRAIQREPAPAITAAPPRPERPPAQLPVERQTRLFLP